MRRIHYISEFADSLSPEDVEEITRVSAANNARDGITGMLMASGQLFFQLIEGPDEAVDALYNRILGDRRHKNVMVLGDERGDLQRQCPDWAMRKVDLSLDAAVRSEPLKVILEVSVNPVPDPPRSRFHPRTGDVAPVDRGRGGGARPVRQGADEPGW